MNHPVLVLRRRWPAGAAWLLSVGLLVLLTTAPALAQAPSSSAPPSLPASPRRVISMSPPITEAVFAIGAGERLVGRTDFCQYPPEATRVVSCGGYINPSFEALLTLAPDLVLIQGEHPAVREFCDSRGIPVMSLKLEGIEGVLNDLLALGVALDSHASAEALVTGMRADLDALRMDRPEGSSAMPRPRVFISLMRPAGPIDALYSTGRASFVSELVVMAGGRNIFDDLTEAYPRISKEALIERQPEVILEILPGGVGADARPAQAWVNDWRPLATLGAVQRGDVRVVNEPAVIVPGPRLPTALRAIRAALHPELASLDEALPVVPQPQRHD